MRGGNNMSKNRTIKEIQLTHDLTGGALNYTTSLSEVFNKTHLYLRRGWVIFDEGIPSYISCRNDGEKFFWIISFTDYKKNEEGWNQ